MVCQTGCSCSNAVSKIALSLVLYTAFDSMLNTWLATALTRVVGMATAKFRCDLQTEHSIRGRPAAIEVVAGFNQHVALWTSTVQ